MVVRERSCGHPRRPRPNTRCQAAIYDCQIGKGSGERRASFFLILALCRPGNNLRRCPGSVHGTCLRRALSTNLSERTWPDGHCSTPSSSIWAVSSHAVATTSPIPPATLQHIKDRNKADSMVGFILVVQMMWFLASLCERITQYS